MITMDRCGYCIHIRDLIDGWKPACDAFPYGIDYAAYDIPGRDCGNGLHFEVNPERKDDYERTWGDSWFRGPYNVEQCYDSFVNSDIPKELVIQGNRYFRIIGKLKRYYDSGERVVLLLQLGTFYAPGVSQLTELVDEYGKHIQIPDGMGYEPKFGFKVPYWQGFACLVEPTNIENENQIGDYIRVLRHEEFYKRIDMECY